MVPLLLHVVPCSPILRVLFVLCVFFASSLWLAMPVNIGVEFSYHPCVLLFLSVPFLLCPLSLSILSSVSSFFFVFFFPPPRYLQPFVLFLALLCFPVPNYMPKIINFLRKPNNKWLKVVLFIFWRRSCRIL